MKCCFDLYNKYHNGFDNTPECDREGIRNYLFLADMKVIPLCEEHFYIVEKQVGNKLKDAKR